MTNTKSRLFDNSMLVVDVILCGIILLTSVCKGINGAMSAPLFMGLALLRLWLGFLLHRRSKLAVVPTTIFGLILTSLIFTEGRWIDMFLLRFNPFTQIFYSGFNILGYVWYFDTPEWLGSINLLWLFIVPLITIIYRWAKSQMITSDITPWRQIALGLYIVAIFGVGMIVDSLTAMSILSLVAMAIMILLIPTTFKCDDVFKQMPQDMKIVMAAYALISIAGIVGVYMHTMLSAVAIIAITISLYALNCWYSAVKVNQTAVIWLLVGASLFWAAQYTTNMVRLILLISALMVVAFTPIHFAYTTKRYWSAFALYILTAVVVPILCIGYNPYTVLEAKRLAPFTQYDYAPHGILLVEEERRVSLRDRYGAITPVNYYDEISMVDNSTQCCKGYRDGHFQIYDIRCHRLVSDDWFTQITTICDENYYKLKSVDGREYYLCKDEYNGYIVTDRVPLLSND